VTRTHAAPRPSTESRCVSGADVYKCGSTIGLTGMKHYPVGPNACASLFCTYLVGPSSVEGLNAIAFAPPQVAASESADDGATFGKPNRPAVPSVGLCSAAVSSFGFRTLALVEGRDLLEKRRMPACIPRSCRFASR
jgi:hypothetical protein